MRSLVDIAALRFRPDTMPDRSLPAAGLPWFMALFGRDSLITSHQMLPFTSELAATTLEALADAQGKKKVELTEEEPGRILHELRFGELTYFRERPQSPYYGASDTTPLFLVLLDEYERWTGDVRLVRALERNARAALKWIDEFWERDGDGYIEYQRTTKLGLENQCWKDSWNSILFHDGTLAPTPRATCEIQGYVYDAKVRCARLARDIWKDEALAVRLESQVVDLKRRFNEDYWIPDRQFFALALDGQKKKVDSLCSNIGHLLWSGIVDDDKAQALRDHLMSPKMFSGWGIRTMAEGEGGYNPIAYHNGLCGRMIAASSPPVLPVTDSVKRPPISFPESLKRALSSVIACRKPLPIRTRQDPLPCAIHDGLHSASLGSRSAHAGNSHFAWSGAKGRSPHIRSGRCCSSLDGNT